MDKLFAKFRKRIVDIDGEKVILREPGAKTGMELSKLSKDDPNKALAYFVRQCAINDDGTHRFTDDDLPMLEDLPPAHLEAFSKAVEGFYGDDEKN